MLSPLHVHFIYVHYSFYFFFILLFHALLSYFFFFFFSSRRRHTRFDCDWSSDVCSSDLTECQHEEYCVDRVQAQYNRAPGDHCNSENGGNREADTRERRAEQEIDRALELIGERRPNCAERLGREDKRGDDEAH